MKIRFQNGRALEGITLTRTEQSMRIAVKDGDVMELLNIHGTWVSQDCEPVTVEVGITGREAENAGEDYYICRPELGRHLVDLLFSGSTDDFPEDGAPLNMPDAGMFSVIA